MPHERPQTSSSNHPRKPVLSLILCSRNDQYMGNPVWRLQTTLNYTAQNLQELGREDQVEIIVADWGSDIPLYKVLQLSPVAARIVSFVVIPPAVAHELQKDSPFPEVLALNAAARRVNGQYIGRIDQDTLVGKRFLRTFFEMHDGTLQLDIALDSALLFANRQSIPYRFAVRCPSFWAVVRTFRWFGRFLRIEHPNPLQPFYCSYVGIWLLHRNLWNECGGYDERMIHMDDMESDMAARLMEKYKMVDLGKIVNYDFYHLDHYHPRRSRSPTTQHRKLNPEFYKPSVFHPNNKDWGLIQYPLEVLHCSPTRGGVETGTLDQPRSKWLAFTLLLLSTGAQIAWDNLLLSLKPAWKFLSVWRYRAGVAWETVRGQPLISWPRLLRQLWIEKKSSQIRQQKT